MLAGSQLIHGQSAVVGHLQNLFQEACEVGIVSNDVVDQLMGQTSLHTRASARIAAIIIASNFNIMGTYIGKLLTMIQNQGTSDNDKVKATLCLGEIGIFKDLSQIQNLIETISGMFQHSHDQIKQAAAISLGSVSIGNTGFFLDKVFKLIASCAPKEKYMFLSTIREIIINKPECLENYISTLMPLYLSLSNSEDESIRNIVSESIGKLFIIHPRQITDPLRQALVSNNVMTVSCCARSFKYSAHNNKNPQCFKEFVAILCELVSKNDLAVKKNALESLG